MEDDLAGWGICKGIAHVSRHTTGGAWTEGGKPLLVLGRHGPHSRVREKHPQKGDENVKLARHIGRAIAVLGVLALCATPALAAGNSASQSAPVATVAAAGAGPQEVAQANPFADVPPNSWAYQAIAKLASEGLIKGYPDGQFKGQRPITRYEAAVLVNRVVDYLEAKISAGQKVAADDMATVKALVDQFGPELKQVQAHLNELDTKVNSLSTQVATNTTTLKRQQFHLYYFLRAPGEYRETVAAYTTAGVGCSAATPCALAPGVATGAKLRIGNALGGGPNAVGPNGAYAGQNTFGTSYQTLRMVFSGAVDDKWSYAIRLEDRYYWDTAGNGSLGSPFGGTSAITPGYCTSAACTAPLDFPANGTMRLNYAYGKYVDPSGFQLTFGRILPLESLSDLGGQLLGLSWADYFNGAQLGYIKNGLQVEAGYGFGAACASAGLGACSAAAAPTGQSQQQMWAHGDFDFIPHHLNVGAAYITEIGNAGQTFWNVNTQAYAAPPGGTWPLHYGSIYGTWRFNDNLHLQAEFGHMFGTDPFTGASWYQPNAVWALATFGNPGGAAGSSWAELGFIGNGFNGVSPETDITGTTGYQQLYIGNPGGYFIYYGGIHHKLGNNVDLGIIAQHMQLIPGTDMPSTATTFLTKDDRDSIFLQSLISF